MSAVFVDVHVFKKDRSSEYRKASRRGKVLSVINVYSRVGKGQILSAASLKLV